MREEGREGGRDRERERERGGEGEILTNSLDISKKHSKDL